MKRFFDNLLIYFILFLLATGVAYTVYKDLLVPIAQFSWETKQCVRFIDHKGNTMPCDLNQKYYKEWIK